MDWNAFIGCCLNADVVLPGERIRRELVVLGLSTIKTVTPAIADRSEGPLFSFFHFSSFFHFFIFFFFSIFIFSFYVFFHFSFFFIFLFYFFIFSFIFHLFIFQFFFICVFFHFFLHVFPPRSPPGLLQATPKTSLFTTKILILRHDSG